MLNDDIMNLLFRAAKHMAATFEPTSWAGWIIYILEVLQDETGENEYIEFLECLRDSITERLEGTW